MTFGPPTRQASTPCSSRTSGPSSSTSWSRMPALPGRGWRMDGTASWCGSPPAALTTSSAVSVARSVTATSARGGRSGPSVRRKATSHRSRSLPRLPAPTAAPRVRVRCAASSATSCGSGAGLSRRMEGRVDRAAGRLTVTAQLMQAATMMPLASKVAARTHDPGWSSGSSTTSLTLPGVSRSNRP